MTYTYAVERSRSIYHIVKPGRIYSLCGVLLKWGKIIYPEPPDGKKECRKCTKVLQEQKAVQTLTRAL